MVIACSMLSEVSNGILPSIVYMTIRPPKKDGVWVVIYGVNAEVQLPISLRSPRP